MDHLQFLKWLPVISLSILACTPSCAESQRGEEQREFVRLNSALRALQAAENADKGASLAALQASSCQRLCEFRATCVSAFERYVQALRELDVLEKELRLSHSNPARIGQDLLLAQHKLASAQPLIDECNRLQGELARRL